MIHISNPIEPTHTVQLNDSELINMNTFDILKNYSETEYPTPHLVHRLDAETTGILIISKTHKSAKEKRRGIKMCHKMSRNCAQSGGGL